MKVAFENNSVKYFFSVATNAFLSPNVFLKQKESL